MTPNQISKFNPDVFGIMEFKLSRNRNGLVSYLNAKKKNTAKTKVYSFNTVEGIPNKILPEDSVDIVVTSPPYGDSRTTVAYGQFSRLANQWLDVDNASKIDKELMGGKKAQDSYKFDVKILDKTIEVIGNKDENRVKDVISFFKDYELSIKSISMRKGF